MSTVFQMVRQVLADSKEKLAGEQGNGAQATTYIEKSAMEKCPDCGHEKGKCPEGCDCSGCAGAEKSASEHSYDPVKVADACDYLAENLHLVTDDRSPQEKLAEYAGIREALEKKAMGDEGKGPHQTVQANPDTVSPMSPGAANSAQAGAGANQMDSGEASASGTGIEADGGGTATPEKVIDKNIEPNEKAFPADVSNSLETNADSPPGGSAEMIQKVASMRSRKLAQLVAAGQITKEAAAVVIQKDRAKVAERDFDTKLTAIGPGLGGAIAGGVLGPSMGMGRLTGALGGGALGGGAGALGGAVASKLNKLTAGKRAKALQDAKKKQSSAAPSKLAAALMAKFAEDAINPAQISAGSEPILQSSAGVPSVLSQGTAAGEQVPATQGSDPGRQLIQSITAAINAKKGDAKNVRSEMAKHLSEPAHAASHDSVLQQSLDNTSSAGVKIAATKALLQKWAEQSPEHKVMLAEATQKVKQAMGDGAEAGPPAGGAASAPGAGSSGGMSMPAPGAESSGGGAKMAMGEEAEPVSDAALAAAAQGVSPEEVAMAEEMLEAQMAPPAEAEMEAPPVEEGAAAPAPAPAGMGAPPPEAGPTA